MIIGITKETYPDEKRVALVPSHIPMLTKAGIEVVVEAGSGIEAGFPDESYGENGARIVDHRQQVYAQADVILHVRFAGANQPSGAGDLRHYRTGQSVIGLADPLGSPAALQEIAAKGVRAFSLELLPRISRAQSMDVLSSMATVAGYRAVLLAAQALPRMFPMMMTAAGTITPAKVLVIGAGVAGLQAIATARRLGGECLILRCSTGRERASDEPWRKIY